MKAFLITLVLMLWIATGWAVDIEKCKINGKLPKPDQVQSCIKEQRANEEQQIIEYQRKQRESLAIEEKRHARELEMQQEINRREQEEQDKRHQAETEADEKRMEELAETRGEYSQAQRRAEEEAVKEGVSGFDAEQHLINLQRANTIVFYKAGQRLCREGSKEVLTIRTNTDVQGFSKIENPENKDIRALFSKAHTNKDEPVQLQIIFADGMLAEFGFNAIWYKKCK